MNWFLNWSLTLVIKVLATKKNSFLNLSLVAKILITSVSDKFKNYFS